VAIKPGLVLQHGAAGPPGLLGEWLQREAIAYETVPVWEGGALPDPSGRSFVASLGSEHSVRDRDATWIDAELELLRCAVEADVPVLGLCFGGQALSAVLGGGVDILDCPEIGWIPIRSEADWLAPGPWLHYHKEVLRVPAGAQRLAHNDVGPAAFVAGPHLGTQFHPEATPEIADTWASRDDQLSAAGVTRAQLAAQGARYAKAAREAALGLFDVWWTTAQPRRVARSAGSPS
jgi:GMP synthase-like glutamine amidotransferase